MTAPDWVVLRLDEACAAASERWAVVSAAVAAHVAAERRVLVVCPALPGVDTALAGIVAHAAENRHAPYLRSVRRRHENAGEVLGVDALRLLAAPLDLLDRLARGCALTGEMTERLRAQVTALGPIMASHLGAGWIEARMPHVRWCDPRDVLRAPEPWTSGHADDLGDGPALDAWREGGADAPRVVLVAGGVAGDARGDYRWLGPAGADLTATTLAVRLHAVCVEAWGDLPGLYSADPKRIPNARMLRQLDYAEAQELSTMVGGVMLHPAALGLLRRHALPLEIRSVLAPNVAGTRISAQSPVVAGRLKAVTMQTGVTLVSVETASMWHHVGFLASVFACFARHDLSVNLVATSETNVTVSLDRNPRAADPAVLDALEVDLAALGTPRLIVPCAAISLVGTRIRSILHRLGPVLELFEEKHVHLVSQAASDLNVTFVVDEEQADKLLAHLHALLVSGLGDDELLGPTWQEQFHPEAVPWHPPEGSIWWRRRRQDLLALAEQETPLYVYDQETLRASARSLATLQSVARVFYSLKANPHAAILRLFAEMGLGFECVSPGEMAHVRAILPELAGDRMLFTPNFAAGEEYQAGFDAGAWVTLDNLEPLETWPDLFRGRDLLVRIDPGEGGGHHRHVRTAGPQSKFGVSEDQLDLLVELLAREGATVVGLHAHVGSGIRDARRWPRTAAFLARVAERFPEARILDLGGGLGVPEKSGEPSLDLAELDERLAEIRSLYPQFELWLEPGRFLVAQAGVLLARVTQCKQKGRRAFVGTNAGMNSLIRPALYGASHEIVNLTRLGEAPDRIVDVVGPICETGDVLGHDRRLPATRPGDILLVSTVGAYGHAMSSRYNLREPAAERMLRETSGPLDI